MDLIDAIGQLLSLSWRFFTDVTVPGFNFSFAVLFVGLFLASFGLRFLFMLLDMDSSGSTGYGAARKGNTKIDSRRQHDEK